VSDVTIGRLAIRMHGDVELGRRLAQLVAERLADGLAPAAGDASLERLNLELTAMPEESVESLATRISARIGVAALEAGR